MSCDIKAFFCKISTCVKKITDKPLFGKNFSSLTKKQKAASAVFNVLVLLLAALMLGMCSLRLAYGEGYSHSIFESYFSNGYIIALNLVPPILLLMFFFGLTGRGWIAFLLDSIVVLGFSIANYFLLRFRDDPLMFSDILYVREAAGISKEGYDFTLSTRMVMSVVICLIVTVLLFFFQKIRLNLYFKVGFSLLPILCAWFLMPVYSNTEMYDVKTRNNSCINRWSATQVYISKGFVYPFIHSIGDAFVQPPEGYSEEEAKQLLSVYKPKYPREDKKVNVIAIMLEANCDLGELGIEGINPKAYEVYRTLREENLSGTLITNIFAGGTVDSERAFLTGYADLEDYRSNINSYVRLFNEMGYVTTGAHPSDDWFYNRKNVNSYIGFSDYKFSENYFYEIYGENMRLDGNAFNEFYKDYENHIASSDKPYFAFHVTYQGHGPYSSTQREWGDGSFYNNPELPEEHNFIIDNYLGSVYDTGWQIKDFVDKIKAREEPCVVLLFGDHKPWLGDSNSVYSSLGINFDLSTSEGFANYYGTQYIIVANDAAKRVIGNDFSGEGPMTSPCMLMSVLFDELGFEGNEFMQFSRTVRQEIPAFNLVGAYDKDGNYYYCTEMPKELKKIYDTYMRVAYYTSTSYKQ